MSKGPAGAPGATDWALLLALTAIWGSAFGATRSAVAVLPPLSVAAARVALGAAVLLLLSHARGHALPRDRARWVHITLIAGTGYALPFGLIAWGQQRVDSGLAGILMAVMPLVTLVLSRRFLATEQLGRAKVAGFGLGFAGIVVLMGPSTLAGLGGDGTDFVRQAAVLAGAVCYAASAILIRLSPPTHALPLSAGALLVAGAMLVPIAAVVDQPWRLDPDQGALFAVAFLGVVATGVASHLYFVVIERAGPTFLSSMNFMIPFVALGTGALAYDEQPTSNAWLALGLLLLGLWLGQRRPTRTAPT